MIKQINALYQLINDSASLFAEAGLSDVFFMDVYRSQPLQPEPYEFYHLPAIFFDISQQGQGLRQPRLVTLTLHIVIDELPDASNVSMDIYGGLNRFRYCVILQRILEGKRLGKSSQLSFVSEDIIDSPVVNYHAQVWQFEVSVDNMDDMSDPIIGDFEHVILSGNIKKELS